MAKKADDAPKMKAEKAEKDASDDAGNVSEDEIAKVEAEMAAAAAAEEESAEPESGPEDIEEDEIARVEAEMAAAAAAEEAAAKAASVTEEPETELFSEGADPSADTSEEDEIARVEAEMAAEVQGDAASSEPESGPVHSTADSIRSGVADGVFKPPTISKGRPKQESLDLESDSDLGPMRDVEVEIRGVVFQKDVTVGELAKIEVGSIMRGGSAEGPLVVQVGERKVAKGRAVVVDDRYGVVIDELII